MEVTIDDTREELNSAEIEMVDEEIVDELILQYDGMEIDDSIKPFLEKEGLFQGNLSDASLSSIVQSIAGYNSILHSSRDDEIALKVKEKCIYKLTKLYLLNKQHVMVMNLLKELNGFFNLITKAKTAKIVRTILDIVGAASDSAENMEVQVSLCKEIIDWCKVEKRTFLRQRIETKLAYLLLLKKQPSDALLLVSALLKELKQLDDKQMLTEVHLLESRVNHSLENIPKAKAALTASRTAANAIYVTPLLQAELDEMSGTLHCEESDNVTAFSYFLEAFEAYSTHNDSRAVKCLQYMCLAKILGDNPQEVPSLLAGKQGVKYSQHPAVQAMREVAKAAKDRSLKAFQSTVAKYAVELRTDDLTNHHLDVLYDKMMQGNLLRIVHPFSCVEIEHVARLIELPLALVERKLSQMILDGHFHGILDQGAGHLIIYEGRQEDPAFTQAAEVIVNMSAVVDVLSVRAKNFKQ